MRRLVIAGAGSGVGKTTIATGIISRLSKRYSVQAFKVGPDFIDPMFHTLASGRPSRNLDSFFMDKATIGNLFGWSTQDADIAIIEGVRGLYDGLSATGDTGSTAEIAKLLDASVILVVNARSLAKSAAAVVMGFKMLDPEVRIEGVILNQVSGERHRQKATEAVESLTDTKVVGTIERDSNRLAERHLGLVTPDDIDASKAIADVEGLVRDIDMDPILEISEKGRWLDLPIDAPFPEAENRGVRIGVPRDSAYSFYYQENLESLQAAGAELVMFSPLKGDTLPDADGYYLGGGYPEMHLETLSANRDFLDGIEAKSSEGCTIYGECGGMMTLCRSISNGAAKGRMAGVFDHDAVLTEQRQGLSYVISEGTGENFLFPGRTVKGHEFHYSKLVPQPDGPYAFDVTRGTGVDGRHDGLVKRRTIGTYMHQHALANKEWGLRIVESCLERV
ncbi:MAG TPA: cobyrinate a,c-diamide synthase [Methanomassiliicoccales archaeon]|jgi:cobyrinic acid a,c-diamide synthase